MFNRAFFAAALFALPVLGVAPAASADEASEQGLEIVLGMTPTCPYGVKACWPNLREALQQVKQIAHVGDPNPYNCTAQVRLKAAGLPDLKQLQAELSAQIGRNALFRGVELTLEGTVEKTGGKLVFKPKTLAETLVLGPLQHKLQWNYHKAKARGPEEEERLAYQQLEAQAPAGKPIKVRITGPLQSKEAGPQLEVREFFVLNAGR